MNDLRDWAVLILVSLIWIVATALLAIDLWHRGFKLDAALFTIWSGVVSTVTTIYHVITVHDDKRPDAP